MMSDLSLPSVEGMTRMTNGGQAALYVRRLIFDGRLQPGQRVPQDEIAKALGISRIPLREALVALEHEGWVTLEMNRGAFVNALDEQSVRDHYAIFGLVYGYAVRMALVRSGAELVDRLVTVAEEFKTARKADAGDVLLRFHATMVDGARSSRIKAVLRGMATIVPGDFFGYVPNALEVERKGIPVIVRALKQGDGEKAAREYERMMTRLADEVVAVMRKRGLFAAA
jgi:DNA-binding GntR family transcriptional regulator